MFAREDIDRLMQSNGDVLSTDRDKIGGIGTFYTDDESGEPTWLTVKMGLFGASESFAPLEGASVDGDDILIPYTKDQVKDAPRVAGDEHMEESEEERLYSHYGFGEGTSYLGTRRAGEDGGTRDTSELDAGAQPGTDEAMTRSEERLNVGTESRPAGRARLRKYVTTENVTTTVPVEREEVRLEREPITDANRDAAMSDPDLTEDEVEVTLHEEQPVVEKETVPVERVRLDKDTVTEDVTVSDDVRKENIEAEGTDETPR
ncbi:YsnF/AvaK domain-containing protein [bacterium RCC_150]